MDYRGFVFFFMRFPAQNFYYVYLLHLQPEKEKSGNIKAKLKEVKYIQRVVWKLSFLEMWALSWLVYRN